MATIIAAILVFGGVALAVWYMIDDKIHHKGKTGCSCGGSCSHCGGGCDGCGGCH